MLFLLPILAWESDATLRAALEQSFATSITSAGGNAALSGFETEFDAQTVGDTAQYGVNLGGAYARLLQPSVFADTPDPPPSNNLSASLATRGSWQTSPLTRLSLDANGFMASRLGVRAEDTLAARDPFLGDRVQYTFGGGSSFSAIASRRSTWTFSGGYSQAGAVAADDARAVGIDAHIARAGIADSYEIGESDALVPELRYTFTHFYHALYDVYLNRGPADIHAGTADLGERHRFSKRLTGTVAGGVTVASPMPILQSNTPVVSPDVRAQVEYMSKRSRASASYTYAYTSLGPRVGFGHEHSANLELAARPLGGARYRDFWITGVGRFAYGTAPIAENPPLATGDLPPQPADGVLTTYTGVAGVRLEYPLVRGVAFLAGFDLEYIRAVFNPPPPSGQTEASFRTIAMIGLAGTLSTDKRNTVRREEDDFEDERLRSRISDPDGERNIDDDHAPRGLAYRGTPQTTLESSEEAKIGALEAKEAAEKKAAAPRPKRLADKTATPAPDEPPPPVDATAPPKPTKQAAPAAPAPTSPSAPPASPAPPTASNGATSPPAAHAPDASSAAPTPSPPGRYDD